MVYKFFTKKSAGVSVAHVRPVASNLLLRVKLFGTNNYVKNNTSQLFENLESNMYTHLLRRIIGCADQADMQVISKCNKKYRFLLCVNSIFSKYAWIFPLKERKGVTITNAFQKILSESNRKPDKI